MDGGDIQKVSDIFLEEQDWVPGVYAPNFMWWVTAASFLVFVGGAWWIYQHNKPERPVQ